MEKHIASRRLRKTYTEPMQEKEVKVSSSNFILRMWLAAIIVIVIYLINTYIPGISKKYKLLGIIKEEYNKDYKIEDILNKKAVKVLGIYNEEPVKAVNNNFIKVDSSSIKSKPKINKEITFVVPTTGVITSRYGNREVSCSKVTSFHTGIDIANEIGTDIFSSIDGKVKKIYNNKYYGKTLEIEKDNVITRYAHLSDVLVEENKNIIKGEKIAKMGTTGNSTGPHLHFEILIDGKAVNPEEIINEFKKDKI